MSWQGALLSRWLRYTEQRVLAQATDPVDMRRRFERKARFWFWPPLGTIFRWVDLAGGGAPLPALWVDGAKTTATGAILYFHGGGYLVGSPRTHRAMVARISALCSLPACLVQYRLAPEHPFPAAPMDAMRAYRALLATGIPPERIVLGGDSAGGGLALSLLAQICAADLPRPAMAFALSPWTDLTLSGDSYRTNRSSEVLLPPGRLAELRDWYLQGAAADDPQASPLFADFTGAPPVALLASEAELLLDDSRRMGKELTAQGVTVTTRIEPGLPHVWPFFAPMLPEARQSLRWLAGQIRVRMG